MFQQFKNFHEFLLLQVPNITDIGLKPNHVKKVGIIGGGIMGSGIATSLILGNITVFLKEINSEYLLKGMKTVEGGYYIDTFCAPFVNIIVLRML